MSDFLAGVLTGALGLLVAEIVVFMAYMYLGGIDR